MWVGAGKIVLDFFQNDQARIKRRELEKLCKEIKRKYNVSAMEVDDFDDPERCVIGFSAVMPATWKEESARSFMAKICNEIDETAFARVTMEDWDVMEHN